MATPTKRIFVADNFSDFTIVVLEIVILYLDLIKLPEMLNINGY